MARLYRQSALPVASQGHTMIAEDNIVSKAERVAALEAELESAGEISVADIELQHMRGVLHDWVDGVVGIVSSPGVGRVSLIHADGSQSSIASSRLPFLLSRPVRFGSAEGPV
ncbi:MAG: hypothetical protein ACT6Q7_13380 [Blastomonas fulva]|uniref:hypothetical protein n=2 Tax=Blastomonas fulva TaxID=1550728 RepID=UPI0040349432